VEAPLVAGDAALGVLTVGMKREREFSGEEIGILEVFTAKAATALHNARLYQRAQTAYEELRRTQSELLRAQKMDALGRLSSGIAHDFNNLLTVIGGRAELIRTHSPAESRMRRDADLIARTTSRAAALTRQLLAFGRAQVTAPRALDLNSVVEGMWSLLTRLIGEPIEMTFHPEIAPAVVTGDPSQLEQVVLNLCINARDAMPDGGRLDVITTRVTLPSPTDAVGCDLVPGAYVHLAVRDSGVGMDADTLGRIFDPFFTTKAAGMGTGLGLATVDGILRQNAGAVTVESRPGLGSTFHVYLREATHATLPALPLAAAPAEPRRGRETILLVEDEPDVRRFIRDVVEDLGYRVLEAAGPKIARATAAAHDGPIDVLLTDVVMPEESGLVLAAALRESHPGLRVIYMSGYTDAAVRGGSGEPDVPFLQKPFAPIDLAAAIQKVLAVA
jgi:signal transduction histidine kinase